ncbi:MAG: 2'-5' RNA ligase family protein [Candidatus Obscuribacterales bacterium]|nr:2'-5' RNA ligase family protein [Candidatus Obscuribacterales bacterium]
MGDLSYRQMQSALMDKLESTAALRTAVPFCNDFESDNRFCLTCVAFAPSALASRIEKEIIAPLKVAAGKHFYYPAQSLHLTMQNIRTISDPPKFSMDDVLVVAEIIKVLATQFRPFEFEIDGFLKLPTSLALRAYSEPRLMEFVRKFRDELVAAGIPDDKEYISNDVVFGNITICRYSEEPSREFIQALAKSEFSFTSKFTVEELALISTNAVCQPSATKIFQTVSFSK